MDFVQTLQTLSSKLSILGIIYHIHGNFHGYSYYGKYVTLIETKSWSILCFVIDRNYKPSIIYGSVLALLKFLKLDPAKKWLPHPSGLLPTIIPASSIALANEEVKHLLQQEKTKGKGVLM